MTHCEEKDKCYVVLFNCKVKCVCLDEDIARIYCEKINSEFSEISSSSAYYETTELNGYS